MSVTKTETLLLHLMLIFITVFCVYRVEVVFLEGQKLHFKVGRLDEYIHYRQ